MTVNSNELLTLMREVLGYDNTLERINQLKDDERMQLKELLIKIKEKNIEEEIMAAEAVQACAGIAR